MDLSISPFQCAGLGNLAGSILQPDDYRHGVNILRLDHLSKLARMIPHGFPAEKPSGVVVSRFADENTGEVGCRYRIDLAG